MSISPEAALRAFIAAEPHITDANSFAVWVHGISKSVIEEIDMIAPAVPGIILDPARLEVVSQLLYSHFSPFGNTDWLDSSIDDSFRSHIRAGARKLLEQLADEWYPIETAPTNGTSVLLLNAHSGEQAIARKMKVKEQEPVWIFAQGFTSDETQVSFRFENPTHWKPVNADIPVTYAATPDEEIMEAIEPDEAIPAEVVATPIDAPEA